MAALLLAEYPLIAFVRHPWCEFHTATAAVIVSCAVLVLFGRARMQTVPPVQVPVHWGYAALHLLALTTVLSTQAYLLHFAAPGTGHARIAIGLWFASLALLLLSLPALLFPLRWIGQVLASLGYAWGYAALTAVFAMGARRLAELVWNAPQSALAQAMQVGCFSLVEQALRLLYPRVLSDPSAVTIGTPSFQVRIAGSCSGIEGLGLMLVLTLGWLFYSRRELRLLRAALLVPASLALMWLLNVVRIVALIAIGNVGYPEVAAGGFHSQAGWILFNTVAIGFLFAASHIAWFRTASNSAAPAKIADSDNFAAAYLIPFLAIVACSLVTRAASSGFEYLYPLRLVIAASTLWYFHAAYQRSGDATMKTGIDWRFRWVGPLTGIVVFLLWISISRMGPPTLHNPTATALAHLPAWQRYSWLAARVLAAVVTVPIAEELAFRGYLARRVLSADVENVPLRRLNFPAILISSAAFGLMHGSFWFPGILAGVLYALVAKFRGRLGEAIAAHATSNLLLAIWVLSRHDYTLW